MVEGFITLLIKNQNNVLSCISTAGTFPRNKEPFEELLYLLGSSTCISTAGTKKSLLGGLVLFKSTGTLEAGFSGMTIANGSNTHRLAASTCVSLHSQNKEVLYYRFRTSLGRGEDISLCLITLKVKLDFAVGFPTHFKKDERESEQLWSS